MAADVFHGRLPNSIVMPLELIPASFPLTRRGISMIPRLLVHITVHSVKIQISDINKSDKDRRRGDNDGHNDRYIEKVIKYYYKKINI